MKTSTIMWTLAVLIMLFGAGAYWYSASPALAPAQTEAQNTGGSNLPEGDMAPVPSTPIASTSASANVTASTSLGHYIQ